MGRVDAESETTNLAKLDDGLAESPNVMVGETKQKRNWEKIGAY